MLAEVHKADSLRDDRPLRGWASSPSLPDDRVIKHSQRILGIKGCVTKKSGQSIMHVFARCIVPWEIVRLRESGLRKVRS